MAKKPFTPKEEKFIQEYLRCRNATKAAKRSGYSEASARQIGSENLSKPYISAEIARRRDILAKKYDITQEKIIQELAHAAFARPKDYMSFGDHDVELYESDDLGEGMDAAIKKVKRVCTENGVNVEVEFHGKRESLELLAKILGFIDGKHNNGPDDPVFDEAAILEAVRKVKSE